MSPLLVLLLALQLLNATTLSKILNVPLDTANSLNDKLSDYSLFLPPELSTENAEFIDDEGILTDLPTDIGIDNENVPLIQTFQDKTELKFRQPIESVNVDYARNSIVLKFYKNNAKSVMRADSVENEKKKSLQDNFIRFGKRSSEEFPVANILADGYIEKGHGMRLERSHQAVRDARGDNFMRFGRSGDAKNDFIRFGRGTNDFMRFGRSPSQDFMRFGRAGGSNDFMRFGRGAGADFMRFGRSAGNDFMRFGRSPSQDFMRFGRNPNQGFMRFGRTSHENFMRFGRNSLKIPVDTNFMRFGRALPQSADNFMRFGKSMKKLNDKNSSQPLMDKNELKQAVKLIHEADKNDDNENPVDKAMKVLFDKHRQRDTNDNGHDDMLSDESSPQHDDNNGLNSPDTEYFLKVSQ